MYFGLPRFQVFRQNVQAGAREFIEGTHLVREERWLLLDLRRHTHTLFDFDRVDGCGRIALDVRTDAHALERRRGCHGAGHEWMQFWVEEVVEGGGHVGHPWLYQYFQARRGHTACFYARGGVPDRQPLLHSFLLPGSQLFFDAV